MQDSVIAFDSHRDDFTAWLRKCNNSEYAPGFGKYYHILATNPVTHNGLLVYAERFLNDEDAKAAFDEYISTRGDEIAARIKRV